MQKCSHSTKKQNKFSKADASHEKEVEDKVQNYSIDKDQNLVKNGLRSSPRAPSSSPPGRETAVDDDPIENPPKLTLVS